jgi:hypothetical protein
MKGFFVSYNSADRTWAEWIAELWKVRRARSPQGREDSAPTTRGSLAKPGIPLDGRIDRLATGRGRGRGQQVHSSAGRRVKQWVFP